MNEYIYIYILIQGEVYGRGGKEIKYQIRYVWGILVLGGPLYYNGERGREGEDQRSWGGLWWLCSVSGSIHLTATISNHIQTNTMGFLLFFIAPKRPTVPPIY